jgi:hypothetical protein
MADNKDNKNTDLQRITKRVYDEKTGAGLILISKLSQQYTLYTSEFKKIYQSGAFIFRFYKDMTNGTYIATASKEDKVIIEQIIPAPKRLEVSMEFGDDQNLENINKKYNLNIKKKMIEKLQGLSSDLEGVTEGKKLQEGRKEIPKREYDSGSAQVLVFATSAAPNYAVLKEVFNVIYNSGAFDYEFFYDKTNGMYIAKAVLEGKDIVTLTSPASERLNAAFNISGGKSLDDIVKEFKV